LGATEAFLARRPQLLVGGSWDWAAINALLLGFIPAMAFAVGVRLFPLFLRMRLAYRQFLGAVALFLGGGTVLLVAGVLPGAGRLSGLGALLLAPGLLFGAVTVRVFEPRLTFPGDQGRYSVWKDPAALGVLTAFCWLSAAAVLLLLYGLQYFGLVVTPGVISHVLPAHALGAGFLTLLLLGVGSILLPGFGGTRPVNSWLIWLAVGAGNAAAILRVGPLAWVTLSPWAGAAWWFLPAVALSGVVGVLAVGTFAAYLWQVLTAAPSEKGAAERV